MDVDVIGSCVKPTDCSIPDVRDWNEKLRTGVDMRDIGRVFEVADREAVRRRVEPDVARRRPGEGRAALLPPRPLAGLPFFHSPEKAGQNVVLGRRRVGDQAPSAKRAHRAVPKHGHNDHRNGYAGTLAC